jgi:hypothetical protein
MLTNKPNRTSEEEAELARKKKKLAELEQKNQKQPPKDKP